MRLGHAETSLLEDCYEDWRGLWEIPWRQPPETVAEAIALLVPLVAEYDVYPLRISRAEQPCEL